MKKSLVTFIILFLIIGCNKDKKLSNRLSGEAWEVSALAIGDNSINELPELNFNDCSIYKESCSAKWNLNDSSADFIWQFREKGSILEISNQSTLTNSKNNAVTQCMSLSGVYEVVESDKKRMQIISENTIGYTGKIVSITLNKK